MPRRTGNGLRIPGPGPIIEEAMTTFSIRPLLALSFLAVVIGGCASSKPTPTTDRSLPPSAKDSLSSDSTKLDSSGLAATQPALVIPKIDSTSPPPRPTVLISGQNNFAVRTKLVPRVMASGWVLMVNKPDSMEFFRPADSTLTAFLFGLVPTPGMKLRLRFILTPEQDGTRIALMGHLIGKDGPLPYVAQEAPLLENLNSLQADLLAAPPMQPPEKSGKKKKK